MVAGQADLFGVEPEVDDLWGSRPGVGVPRGRSAVEPRRTWTE